MVEYGVEFNWTNPISWTWFQGDLNEYYNELIGSDSKRYPNKISSYAVHRWMGKARSTLVQHELIHDTIRQFIDDFDHRKMHLLNANWGLGAGLMWFETNAAQLWKLVGHRISTARLDFFCKLPPHKFEAVLKPYDDLGAYKTSDDLFDAIYSIEAFVYSPNQKHTLRQWSEALAKGGIIVIIDDFLSVGVDKEADDIQLFSNSWMARVLQTRGPHRAWWTSRSSLDWSST